MTEDELKGAVLRSIWGSFGSSGPIPHTTPIEQAPNVDSLKRNLVRDIGGFTLDELNKAWAEAKPWTIGDVPAVVLKARSAS